MVLWVQRSATLYTDCGLQTADCELTVKSLSLPPFMSNRALSWSILVLLSLVWGSSFILMKRGLEAFSSDEVAAMRISIAFLFLLPLQIKHYGVDLKRYGKGLLVMGIFGNLIPAFLFTLSETQISSSLAGMLNALTPLFTVLVAFMWIGTRPSGRMVSGIIIGLVAAVALMVFEKGENVFMNFSYGFLVVVATVCYGISITGIKKYLGSLSSVAATVWAFTITGPLALIYLFGFTDFTHHLRTEPRAMSSLGYTCILAIGGTALSVILYNVLIKKAGIMFASSCTYLIPVVAVLWGIMDGETVNMPQVLSIAVIIGSVYLINRD
jgi:drug/metabolite transporter (DMT)-like permease